MASRRDVEELGWHELGISSQATRSNVSAMSEMVGFVMSLVGQCSNMSGMSGMSYNRGCCRSLWRGYDGRMAGWDVLIMRG